MCIKGVVTICGGGASRLEMENAETGKGNAPIRAALFHEGAEYGRGLVTVNVGERDGSE